MDFHKALLTVCAGSYIVTQHKKKDTSFRVVLYKMFERTLSAIFLQTTNRMEKRLILCNSLPWELFNEVRSVYDYFVFN